MFPLVINSPSPWKAVSDKFKELKEERRVDPSMFITPAIESFPLESEVLPFIESLSSEQSANLEMESKISKDFSEVSNPLIPTTLKNYYKKKDSKIKYSNLSDKLKTELMREKDPFVLNRTSFKETEINEKMSEVFMFPFNRNDPD